MTWINQLLEQHQILEEKWDKRKEKLDVQRRNLIEEQEKLRKDFEVKMTSLEKKMISHCDKRPHHKESILEHVAEKIAKELNLEYEISGPFGLNCHYYLSFLDSDKETVYILYLRPTNENWYGVVTNEVVKEVHPESISAMNDDHKKVIPLPKTIPKIITVMVDSMLCNAISE